MEGQSQKEESMGRRPPQHFSIKGYGLYFIAALNLTLIWIYGQGSGSFGIQLLHWGLHPTTTSLTSVVIKHFAPLLDSSGSPQSRFRAAICSGIPRESVVWFFGLQLAMEGSASSSSSAGVARRVLLDRRSGYPTESQTS